MPLRFSILPGRRLAALGVGVWLALIAASPMVSADKPIPVILDTDIGSDIDDTWALAYLLKCPELDLKLVTTGTADTVYRAKVAAKFLEVAGRTDVPVGIGVRGSGGAKYQEPWVRDYDLGSYPGEIREDGVQALIDLVNASSEPITLIAIGPLPNIAEALRRAPDIAGKIRFVGMHGSIDIGYGGGAPVAETNVRVDVDAFRAVLKAPWLDFRVTPLDTCDSAIMVGEDYQRVFRSDLPEIRALIENYRIWSGLVTWTKVDYFETKSSTLFDTVAVYMAYADAFLEYDIVPIAVTDDGFTVRDPDGIPIRAAMRWRDRAGFLRHLADRLVSTGE